MKNLAFLLLAMVATGRCCFAQAASGARPDFQQLLQKIMAYEPDPCGATSDAMSWNSGGIEASIFAEAADAVVRELNTDETKSPHERATEALKVLEKMSAEANAAWPDENRFHFEIFEFSPALVVKVSVRTQAGFLVFGVMPSNDGKPGRQWRQIWSNFDSANDDVPQKSMDIYPLHRGPSGNVRFLVHFGYSGCARSVGVGYEVYEWDGKYESTTRILHQKGSFGLESPKLFPQIGKLRTKGLLITLPYCWFSVVDWWDNPNLCAVDTYDVSGDDVRFRSRAYNRPDLVPIAKAIEYAGKHDFQAVRGYCGSDRVARRLINRASQPVGSEEVRVARIGNGRERVTLSEPDNYFDVERRASGWVVTAF